MMAALGSLRTGGEPESHRKRLLRALRALGVLRTPAQELEHVEDAMLEALPPIAPRDDFRNQLRDNLALAARQRVANLAIEYPSPVRQGILLGLSAGLATAMFALFLVWRSRRSGAMH
jgi:hypothetical protein